MENVVEISSPQKNLPKSSVLRDERPIPSHIKFQIFETVG